jgi:hypothetical protein
LGAVVLLLNKESTVMNIITTVQDGFSARLFAAITIVSLLLSAFPVAFFVASAANTDAVGTVSAFVTPDPAPTFGEQVQVSFTGTGTLDLEDWKITDASSFSYVFSGVTLNSGHSITICQDATNNTGCDAQWGGSDVWNNGGDTLTLTDENDDVVLTVVWSSAIPEGNTVTDSDSVNYAPADPVEDAATSIEAVKPVFECWVDNGDATGTGYFGYLNENDVAVDIVIGDDNKVAGGPNGNDEGQPTDFMSGRTDFVDDAGVFKPENAAFSVDFPLNSDAVWTLTDPAGDTRTATAGSNGPECPAPVPEFEIPERCSESVDELDVPATNDVGTDTNVTLDNGGEYFAVVEGTYIFGTKSQQDRIADAEYSLDVGNTEWKKEFANNRPDVLDMFIDGVNPDFGAFRADHTYGTFFTGTGATSNFAIQDSPYNDNSGELAVTVYECEPVEEPEPEEPEVCSLNGEIIDYTEAPVQNNNDSVKNSRRSLTALETISSNANFFGKESPFNESDFFSLGIAGFLVYEFTDKVAIDGSGDDIAIWETTGGNANQQSDEKAEVFFSEDGTNFVSVGVATGDASFDISGTGLTFVKFVKLVDQSTGVQGDNGDGFDVDAITIIEGSCEDYTAVQPAQCSITITSDETNTVVEKGGASAKVLSFIHNTWTTTLSNVDWIWGDQGPVNPAQEETQTFIKQFGVNPAVTITAATLEIAADNQFDANLNGTFTEDDNDTNNFSSVQTYDVTNDILAGNNELSVAVTNLAGQADVKKNPAGLYYKLTIEGEGEECGVPYVPEPEEPEYGDYCGDGQQNQEWEQCDGSDGLGEGESCTDYCTIDNQCSALKLAKITLDDQAPASESFNGTIYLGSDSNPIPSGTWFNFDQSGDDSFVDTANAVDGLAVERNLADGKLALAFTGDNGRRQIDYVQGTIMTKGIDLGVVDRKPNPSFPLEDGSGSSYKDIFDKDGGNNVTFDLRADTGNDAVTVEVNDGEEYDCPECKATVEARVILNDSGTAGDGDLSDEIILGDSDYSTVSFGEWFPVSMAANPGDSAVMITDPNTVTNFAAPGDKPGLFVSREDGTVKVALYGEFNPGGETNNEWIDARIEIRDAQITNFTELSGQYKFEDHPLNQVPSNNGFDYATADTTGVDFEMWVDTASDGFRFDVDTDSIAACRDDTVEKEPEDKMYRIDGYKYEGQPLLETSSIDNGPEKLGGWYIELYDGEGNFIDATSTDDQMGYYYFDVPAGDYEVKEAVQDNWEQFGVQDGPVYEYPYDGPHTCTVTLPLSSQSGDSSDEYDSDYRCDFYNIRTENGDDGEGGSGGEEEDENDDDEIIRTSSRGGGSTGTRVRQAAPRPLVAGAATTNFCPFLEDYMQIGAENDTMEVMKLQLFLNIFKDMYGGVENPLTGNFGSITDANVKAFQETYRSEVLDPWFDRGIVPHDRPTGFVYKTTLWKINSIICPDYVNELDFTGESLDSNVDNNQNAIVRD